jgi:D-methionine transport system substrate-binding protein
MKKLTFLSIIAALLLSACGGNSNKKSHDADADKTIVIATTQKPTYPDVINAIIKPELEKKGYTVKLVEIDDQKVFNETLVNGDVDVNIGQHGAALDFEKANNPKWHISELVSVPSAHMGIFSDKYPVKTIDELKAKLQKGDIVAIPDDVSNGARSLIFLENLGIIKLRSDKDKYSASEKDIAENPYELVVKAIKAEQIPRILDGIAVGLIYGDDADLLGILDKAIIREVKEDDVYFIIFVARDEDADKQWAKDLVEVVQSEAFKNVVEDTVYRFHKYNRPSWYREKWGVALEWGR